MSLNKPLKFQNLNHQIIIYYHTDNVYQEPYPNCYDNIDLLGMVDDMYQIVTIYIS